MSSTNPIGTRYLPDFLLPQIKAWAEVKPIPFTAAERHKCESLVGGTGGLILGNYIHDSLRLFFKNLCADRIFLLRSVRESTTIKVWQHKRSSRKPARTARLESSPCRPTDSSKPPWMASQ